MGRMESQVQQAHLLGFSGLTTDYKVFSQSASEGSVRAKVLLLMTCFFFFFSTAVFRYVSSVRFKLKRTYSRVSVFV